MSDTRFCLALDVPNAESAVDWVQRTSDVIGVFKIGLELYCAEGPQIIDSIRNAGAQEIFLDLKLHDIPRTVAGAIHRLKRLGVDYLTVHTGGGRDMLRAASDAAEDLNLLGVTVLTSLNGKDLEDAGVSGTLKDVVLKRARLAVSSGIQGLVSSAQEAESLRRTLGPHPILVTPGIRFEGQASGDQKRVFTPSDALGSGASMIVLGRAVTQARDLDVILGRLRELTNHG